MGAKHYKCARCGSDEGYRSRSRNFFERYLLPVFFLRPVRCGQCYRRSYRPVFQRVREPRDGKLAHDAA
jgi:hypothetical protein